MTAGRTGLRPPRIWSPDADRVDFLVGTGRHPGRPEAGGWWSCPVELPHGMQYQVCRDGGPARPDPRSLDQPRGLHGPSRIFDPSTIAWTDDAFEPVPWDAAVLYELHPGTFTPEGTLDAAAARLDHVARLGITHVELTPVAAFDGERGWGYDGVLLFATHHAYGGPAALGRFVDAAHARGLAVILDVVYNHVGPGSHLLGDWAPYFAEHGTPWGPAPDFTRPEVRRYVLDNASMWLRDFHIDGLRIDAVQTIVDPSEVHILRALAEEVAVLESNTGRRRVLIAETIANERHLVEPTASGGFGLQAHWHEDFHHALHAVLTGERGGYYADYGSIAALAHVIERGYWFDGSRPSLHHGRAYGESAEGLHGRQLVTYLQNHDQVGNRPDGRRITDLSRDAGFIGSALTLLSPFVPMLWQGEEWAATSRFHFFCDHGDPQLRAAVRDGRKADVAGLGGAIEALADPYAVDTLQRSTLDWTELDTEPHAAFLRWYRRLVAIRRSIPGGGATAPRDVAVTFDERARWLRFERPPYEVVANFGGEVVSVTVTGTAVILCSGPRSGIESGHLRLPPSTVAIVSAAAIEPHAPPSPHLEAV